MKNLGGADRAIRFVVGIALAVAAFVAEPLAVGWLHWGALGVGAVLALTGLMAVCPAYTLFGIRTCSARRAT